MGPPSLVAAWRNPLRPPVTLMDTGTGIWSEGEKLLLSYAAAAQLFLAARLLFFTSLPGTATIDD